MNNALTKANTLVMALPYIKKFTGKTIVVKYGGNAMINNDLKKAVIDDIVLLSTIGINVVLVHGGGPEINDMLNKLGKEPKFINGLRYTDEETIDIVQMVLCGKVNKNLVKMLNSAGGKAVGLCGLDGNMLTAKKASKNGADYGYVGKITNVSCNLIKDIIDKGYIPVISTVASDSDHNYNINADTAAAEIAASLKAEKLILLTDIKGLLRDVGDDNSLISTVNVSEVPCLIREGVIKGGMIPKIDCCVKAVRQGVSRAHIIDGRIKHSIVIELLSDEGIGTMFM